METASLISLAVCFISVICYMFPYEGDTLQELKYYDKVESVWGWIAVGTALLTIVFGILAGSHQ